jgi:hypothetical protein
MPRHAKITKINRNVRLIAGLSKHFAPGLRLQVAGKSATVSEVIATIQKHLDAIRAVDAARAAWQAALGVEASLEKQMAPLARYLGMMLQASFGDSPSDLVDFGLGPTKRSKIPLATKAAAIEKSRVTRATRHTKGKKQKAKTKAAARG